MTMNKGITLIEFTVVLGIISIFMILITLKLSDIEERPCKSFENIKLKNIPARCIKHFNQLIK